MLDLFSLHNSQGGPCRSIFIWKPKTEDELAEERAKQKTKEYIYGSSSRKKANGKHGNSSDDDSDGNSGRKNRKAKKTRFTRKGKGQIQSLMLGLYRSVAILTRNQPFTSCCRIFFCTILVPLAKMLKTHIHTCFGCFWIPYQHMLKTHIKQMLLNPIVFYCSNAAKELAS